MVDAGDAPVSYGRPTVEIVLNSSQQALLTLGTKVDAEPYYPYSPGNSAMVDDNNSADNSYLLYDNNAAPSAKTTIEDEDGIASLPALDPGNDFSVTTSYFNNSGNVATIYAFLDLNQDGIFDYSEMQMAGPLNSSAATGRTINFTWPTQHNMLQGQTYLRFIIVEGTGTSAVSGGCSGGLSNKTNTAVGLGEIEDYKVPVNKPLPVTWISFTAEKVSKDVMLQWITTNETGNLGFDIQHSVDGQHWSTIGWQLATEAAYGNHSYSFLHAKPGQGIHFYRLKQIDHDGRTGYSIIQTAVLEQTSEPIVIYPNPVTDKLFIGGREHQQSNIVIIDDHGSVIKSVHVVKGPIDVSALHSGIYFLQLNGSSEWKKFIKQ